MSLQDGYLGSLSTFSFPFGIDEFNPILFNDLTVVNRHHVTDLRKAVCEVENALVGLTDFPYDNTQLIQDGYNIKFALETLDANLAAVQSQLGFIFDGVDGYAGRIDAIEFGLNSHRVENSQTDADGYSVHGVEGFVTGTANKQILTNKTIDSGTDNFHAGIPKFIARASPSDNGLNMLEIYDVFGNLVCSVDEDGDAYFAGDINIQGDRIIQGTDIIKQSLFVDGNTTLGNSSSLDTTTINGNTSIDGTLSVSNDLTVSGSNVTLGDDTGLLDLDFTQVDISQDGYIRGSLVVDKGTILGDNSGGNSHIIRGSILHSVGVLHTSGDFRALGTKFTVEGNTTTVDTDNFIVNSSAVFPNTTINQSGNITSDGYVFTFGNPSTASTNTFLINGTTSTEDLIVTNDIQVSIGSITTPALNTTQLNSSHLNIAGPTTLNDGTQQPGYVWTATDTTGLGQWQPPIPEPWETVVVDGYSVTDSLGNTSTLVPFGFYNSIPGQEIFVQADAYGSFVINLPPSPNTSDRVRFIDFNGGWSSTDRAFVFPESSGVVKTFSDTAINVANDWITIPSHGLLTGQRGTLTGNIPPGLVGFPYLYIIVINTNIISFASTIQDALDGTALDITATGTGSSTFTSGTIMGSGFLELDITNGWAEVVYNGTSWRVITS